MEQIGRLLVTEARDPKQEDDFPPLGLERSERGAKSELFSQLRRVVGRVTERLCAGSSQRLHLATLISPMIPDQVPGDPKQPRARRTAIGLEPPTAGESPGEGLGGEILGHDLPNSKGQVAIDIVEVPLEEFRERGTIIKGLRYCLFVRPISGQHQPILTPQWQESSQYVV